MHSRQSRLNRVIIHLACCCGLRASEIAGLQLADVHVSETRPHLVVRPQNGKGKKGRAVPLWWDAGTLADLRCVEGGKSATDDHLARTIRCLPEAVTAWAGAITSHD
jgi:integrase